MEGSTFLLQQIFYLFFLFTYNKLNQHGAPPLSRILEHVKIRTENKEMEVLDIRTTTTLTLNKKLNNF